MDGNGRWATTKGLARKEGHREGSLAIDRLMDLAIEIGLKNISLYAFSTENWKRPITEVRAIFNLLEEFIDSRLDSILSKNIKILHSGSRKLIPAGSLKRIDRAVSATSKNTGIVINFCLNYGSQDEILNAFHKIIQNRIKKNKNLEKEIKIAEFEEALYTYPLPPVDMLIRTAGEKRVSNFLLWQIAYAEIYFADTLWPDFDKKSLFEALDWYASRTRKFGGLEK
ncbi:MAG: di-trans,poly-cis-decaprenylcistransferase [Leptospiraceae bacterium]|nr:di-trans,poly-cis-decaprenylcistransferase [Leptospiraceae bacterium]